MTRSELFELAEKLYFQEGKELQAIEAFKKLLDAYPDHLNGWTHLSTIQNKITDFDGAISSINQAIQLDPNNAWVLDQKNTTLSLIARFPAEGQIYFDEQTREAHKIVVYPSKKDLLLDIVYLNLSLLDLNKGNERKIHQYNWRLAHTYRELHENEKALKYLFDALSSVPSKYRQNRKERELANIYCEISSNYLELKDHKKAIKYLNKAFELGLDDFKRLMLADIYDDLNDLTNSKLVIEELLAIINSKLDTNPESAYIFQKAEVLKRLGNKAELEAVANHFNQIPKTDYNLGARKRLLQDIEKYLKQNV